MALSAFLNVNGYDFPPPVRGFTYTISTTVNAGRNANNAVIGQRVGRDLIKLDALQWKGIDAKTRKMMLKALDPFYVPVTFEDPGDRKGKPYWVDKMTHIVLMDEIISFNLIDTGRG